MNKQELIKKQYTIQDMVNELQILVNAVREARASGDAEYEIFVFDIYCNAAWFAERICGVTFRIDNWTVIAETA